MDSSSSGELRKYGLEFINDLAKDREMAVQSLGVAFSAFRTGMRQSQIVTRVDDRKFVEDLLKRFDEEVNRTIESQLTRITIKSLGWIKKVLIQDQRIIIKEERKDEALIEELQQKINDLSTELSTQRSEFQHKNQSLIDQLDEKEKAIQGQEVLHKEISENLRKQLITAKAQVEPLEKKVQAVEAQLIDLRNELEEKNTENTTLGERNTALNMEVRDKAAEIERLKESIDQDATDAMETWAKGFQEQEQHYQQSLAQVKQELTEKYEKEVKQLRNDLANEEKERKELEEQYQTQLTEVSANNEFLTDKNQQMEDQISELLNKNDEINEKMIELNVKCDKLEADLEKQAKQPQRPLLEDIKYAKIRGRAQWLEQCLSFSNFAPLTILLRMDGEMPLDTLAKSVGMDPLVLNQQLQALHKRDLIDIRHDGKVVANVPSAD